MTALNTRKIAEARDALRKGEFTAVELTESCLAAAEASAPLNAYIAHTPDLARTQAAAAEQALLDEFYASN